MKKEQILLVVAAGAAALIVFSNQGLYAEVGTSIRDGSDVQSSVNAKYDPRTGLPAKLPSDGRAIIRERRLERRPDLPKMEAPDPLPPMWVHLLPYPRPGSGHWAGLRDRIPVVAPSDDEADGADSGAESVVAPPVDPGDPLRKAPVRDLEKVARLVRSDGSTIPVILTPTGALKGEPTWEILRAWPNVEATIQELNKKTGKILGTWLLNAESVGERFTTVHLEKTCEKEYWERRIRQRVAATDRGGLMSLAEWVVNELVPTYRQEAVGYAVSTGEEALAIKSDLSLVRQLGAYYRAAFDAEGELALYESYSKGGSTNDSAVLELLAGALDRFGAYGPARKHWEDAVAIGSISARLGLAENLYASGELDAARVEFERVEGSGGKREQTAAALEGHARVLINQGQFAEALVIAERAGEGAASDPDVHSTLGAAYYYNGQYAAAERSFRAAVAVSPESHTRPLSNLGMALVAQNKLDEAEEAFRTCLEMDALNFVDPLIGLGEVLQRRGRFTEAGDYFETALVRDPSNPWVLLRLGTAKLASGVPDRALELADMLVKAAPGCVDGLRLAGLSVAAQEKPDVAVALRHLERARQKEPQNIELLRRHSVALLQAANKERALEALTGATDPSSGFARRDGRTLGLLAYVLFLNRAEIDAVRETIDRAKRAEIDESAKAYIGEMRKKIDEWDALRIWEDKFRRTGQKLFGGWVERDESLGIRVSAQLDPVTGENYAAFSGRMKASPPGDRAALTNVERKEDSKKIRKWEADVRVTTSDTQFVMHIYKGALQYPGAESGSNRRRNAGAELALVVTRDGTVEIWSTSGTGGKRGLQVTDKLGVDGADLMWPMDNAFHTIRMVRTDQGLGRWQISLDDEPIGPELEISQLAAARNSEVILGFEVDADRGTQVVVHIDRVEILRTVD